MNDPEAAFSFYPVSALEITSAEYALLEKSRCEYTSAVV